MILSLISQLNCQVDVWIFHHQCAFTSSPLLQFSNTVITVCIFNCKLQTLGLILTSKVSFSFYNFHYFYDFCVTCSRCPYISKTSCFLHSLKLSIQKSSAFISRLFPDGDLFLPHSLRTSYGPLFQTST